MRVLQIGKYLINLNIFISEYVIREYLYYPYRDPQVKKACSDMFFYNLFQHANNNLLEVSNSLDIRGLIYE